MPFRRPLLDLLLRRTKDGKLRISKGAVANEARVAQRSVTTPGQQHIFKALRLTEPARFHDFELTKPAE